MKATEDFLLVVLYAYVVAAAKSWMSSHGDYTISVLEIAQKVVTNWVKINLNDTNTDDMTDMVNNYTTDF